MSKQKLPIKIVIASGKGGVGKSILASSLAILYSKLYSLIALDCDVDAPNLALWLNEYKNWDRRKKISTSEKPVFDYEKCNQCGICIKACRFEALEMVNNKPCVDKFVCEGCGACEVLCPQKAIKLKMVQNGEMKVKKTRYGFDLISGQLYPGETGSGKIVSQLKEEADKYKNKTMVIIDSSPGTGCPVIAVLRDASYVVLITEPTVSGVSDIKKILELVNYFKLPYGIVINKWDINKKLSKKLEKLGGSCYLGKISYDKNIFKAINSFQPIADTDLKAKSEIKSIYKTINKVLQNNYE